MVKTKTPLPQGSRNKKLIVIGLISAGLIGLFVLGLFVVSAWRAFANEPDPERLQTAIVTEVDAVEDVFARYGHSGAPWNNNINLWVEIGVDNENALVDITKRIGKVILEQTKESPNYTLTITYVESSAESGENLVAVQTVFDDRYQAVCDEIFTSAYCRYAIEVTKQDLQTLVD